MSDCPDCCQLSADHVAKSSLWRSRSSEETCECSSRRSNTSIGGILSSVLLTGHLTLYPMHFDPVSHVHHLDERPLICRNGIVNFLLVSNPRPVVCEGFLLVPAGVLMLATAVLSTHVRR